MEKEPFNQAGIDNILSVLYAMPDNELQAEAGNVEADFRSWLIGHIGFTDNQQEYVLGMSDAWMTDSGRLTSLALKSRLPVVLEPPGPVDPLPHSSKYVRTVDGLVISDHHDEGPTYTGQITFRIEYI